MKFFKNKGAVGLQLETGVIRAVEITGTLRTAALVKAEKIEVPETAIVEGVVENAETVAGALKELWTRSHIGSREVVLGVSNQGVLMRLANLPKVEPGKLEKMLRFQAGDYFPIPLSEMVLDYAVVDEVQGETGPQLEVLMVAVRQDLLDKSLETLTCAGLVPRIVDVSPLALMRTLPESRLTGTTIFVDMADGITSLMLVTGGIPRFIRIIPTNLQTASEQDNYFAEIILQSKQQAASTNTGDSMSDIFLPDDLIPEAESQVSFTNAAESKSGSFAPGEIIWKKEQETEDPIKDENMPGNVWYNWAGAVAEEIRSSIGFYLAQRDSLTVDCLFLSGCGARAEEVKELFNLELDIPVEVINPIVSFKGAVNTLNVDWNKVGPDFAVAVGLALRGMET
ncbi:type IV pilus assembly protein PilM [Desulfotomaculum arcticum]|uniref:Type IV pilus assembly protein PilM n=1 Tax=Desulfotruncus arcticus DSM 17038 TaxID=1121424 RepID=A0A1I2MPY2_9FIRM|nr:type IV pilus assembly protein PilM [Desulfotruncus arcticus]SFF92759.1 type IV pilus assembly protein PilM [Desulfotomaculum arcticum] [Desulfotruncus arcticus DSM 17038]